MIRRGSVRRVSLPLVFSFEEKFTPVSIFVLTKCTAAGVVHKGSPVDQNKAAAASSGDSLNCDAATGYTGVIVIMCDFERAKFNCRESVNSGWDNIWERLINYLRKIGRLPVRWFGMKLNLNLK